jgi:hypothetical protein
VLGHPRLMWNFARRGIRRGALEASRPPTRSRAKQRPLTRFGLRDWPFLDMCEVIAHALPAMERPHARDEGLRRTVSDGSGIPHATSSGSSAAALTVIRRPDQDTSRTACQGRYLAWR